MHILDWIIIAAYFIAVTAIGVVFKKRAEGGVEDFFLSGRRLPWWLAGTSLVATSFSSDTPLFVTGLIRKNGISGNWHWWFMALASIASLFFFARLWRRARIVTDMEFIELRYGPGAGSALRGIKAGFFGIFFNVYALGAWPVLGLTKVLEETTLWSKGYAVIFCSAVALVYTALSGLWGVVATDLLQFTWAMCGAIALAAFAVSSMGGLHEFWQKMHGLSQVSFFAPHSAGDFWNSPFIFFLSLVLIQWWARGVEGDGVAVQRLSACKNEKQSFYAMLWFNIAHYALRPWPWILVGLASLILLPTVTDSIGMIDHERAYPRMIVQLVPSGIRGLILAAFFASFMATVETHLNWGSSYIINDVYKRFIRKDAGPKHYVWIARLATVFLMMGGAAVALATSSIVQAFYNVLLVFSGVGLVGIGRWYWWRVNAWSEIAAMAASGLLTLLSAPIAGMLGVPGSRPVQLIIVVVGSIISWLTVTYLTKPTSEEVLKAFYLRVRPAGPGWEKIARLCPEAKSPDRLKLNAVGWIFGVLFVLGITMAIGKSLLGFLSHAMIAGTAAAVGLIGLVASIRKMRWDL